MMAADETATVAAIKAWRELIGEHVRGHRGRVADSPGDNLRGVLKCGRGRQMRGRNPARLAVRNAELAPGRRMGFRIGL